MQTALALTIHG